MGKKENKPQQNLSPLPQAIAYGRTNQPMFHEANQKIKVARFLWTMVYIRRNTKHITTKLHMID